MRVGVTVPMSAGDGQGRMPTWPEILQFAVHAERLGFDSLWVCDHFTSDPGDRPAEGIHEAWTIVSALAASTTSVELGQLVLCAAFRSPALLAKMAATADWVSGGRLTIGLGVGSSVDELESFGYRADHRVSRFEEAVTIVRGLLRDGTVKLDGRFHLVPDGELLPRPARPIPLLIAGNSRRVLGITARSADAWNTAWFSRPDGRLDDRLRAMDAALHDVGRAPETLRRTIGIRVEDPASVSAENRDPDAFGGSVDELVEVLEAYARLGFDDVIVGLAPMSVGSLERLATARRRSAT